jgi:hypothetical protein
LACADRVLRESWEASGNGSAPTNALKMAKTRGFWVEMVQNPKKTVENQRFSIDFAQPKAALLRTTGLSGPA